MKLFVTGRTTVFDELQQKIRPEDAIIWIHAASLGEYEQAVPVMQAIQKDYPTYKILISFFSPSGYEIKKNDPLAFLTVYLPLDTKANAKKFIQLTRPKLAVFVKYEVWPNYLFQLQKSKIPAVLLSGVFRENQLFFKPYGKLLRKALHSFQHIFVQEEPSEKLLQKAGFSSVSVGGDTRFDRVSQQLNLDNQLDFIARFKGKKLCMVCGSTWPEDEAVLLDFINKNADKLKFIIAPHQIKATKIADFRRKINPKTILFSAKNQQNLNDYQVFIIDTVGLLTKIYNYADIAYVGGAMGHTGLHNILEPAAFGIPVIFGPHHKNFPEASQLKQARGGFSVNNAAQFEQLTSKLIEHKEFRKQSGQKAYTFVQEQTGATKRFMRLFSADNQNFR